MQTSLLLSSLLLLVTTSLALPSDSSASALEARNKKCVNEEPYLLQDYHNDEAAAKADCDNDCKSHANYECIKEPFPDLMNPRFPRTIEGFICCAK